MANNERPLSVAEVVELPAGDADNTTWINEGVSAVVRSIVKRTTAKGGPMWICELTDPTGSATAAMSVYTAPKFAEGDQIEVSGKGVRRTEYNGKAQIALGRTSEVHLIGRSVYHEEQKDRAAAGQPAIDGTKQAVYGATVGMAIKEALALLTRNVPVETLPAVLNLPRFWAEVHTVASDIVRLQRTMEAGTLALSVRERTAPKPAASNAAPPPARSKSATDLQLSNVDPSNLDEDVPF